MMAGRPSIVRKCELSRSLHDWITSSVIEEKTEDQREAQEFNEDRCRTFTFMLLLQTSRMVEE